MESFQVYNDYPDTRFYLGSYGDTNGFASVLISIEAGLDNDLKWLESYHLRGLFYRPSIVSVSITVQKTLKLLNFLPLGVCCASYSNTVNTFTNLLQARGKGRIVVHWKTRIDPLEGYQILQDLLTNQRLTLEPGEGVDRVAEILKNVNIEAPINPLVGALFHSVCVIERNRINSPQGNGLEIFTI